MWTKILFLLLNLQCSIKGASAFPAVAIVPPTNCRRVRTAVQSANEDLDSDGARKTSATPGAGQAQTIDGGPDDEVATMVELGREKLQPYFDFPLDDWQLQAGGAILQGHNVIVAAPTGAGPSPDVVK